MYETITHKEAKQTRGIDCDKKIMEKEKDEDKKDLFIIISFCLPSSHSGPK